MRFHVWAVMVIFYLMAGILPAGAERYFADYYHVPAPSAKSGEAIAESRNRHVLPDALIRDLMVETLPALNLQDYAQASATKKVMEEAPPEQAAWGVQVRREAKEWFGGPVALDEGGYVFPARVISKDAIALRIQADLGELNAQDSLYVMDALGRASFGPYTSKHTRPGGAWLPTTLGDAVILVLWSSQPVCPAFRVEAVSHFYKSIFNGGNEEALSCNIPIAEETDIAALNIASGIGVLIIPYGVGQGFCTGSLLTTKQLPANGTPEPYLISSWHCFTTGWKSSGIIAAKQTIRTRSPGTLAPTYWRITLFWMPRC